MSEREQAAARRDEPLPEGDERAPPGTRAMAILRWGIVALMAAVAAGSWIHFAADRESVGAQARWQCPMHPRITTAHRGECPICGMDLVPVDAATPSAAPASAGAAASAPFLCPMHLGVGSTDAAARCPECGMILWARDRALAWAAEHGAQPAPPPEPASQVPGLVAVELGADRVQLSGMKTAVAARQPLATTLRTAGFVAASETAVVSVTTRFAGWIETLGAAQTGRLVRKGDVLATIYSPDLLGAQQAYLNAARWTEGPTGLPSSVNDLERDARARLEQLGVSAEDIALLAAGGRPLREVSVRAPARGHITRRAAVRGLYVAPGTELFQIADLGAVWVLVDVHEGEIGRVRPGQRAVFETSAWPGERFTGRVSFVSPALNAATRTLQARLELGNGGLKLRPGMYGEVALELGAAEAVVIPRGALVDTGEVQYVFVAKDGGRLEPRRVRAGWSDDEKVAILEGVSAGERVVTTATFLVDSESRLRAAIEGLGGDAPHAR